MCVCIKINFILLHSLYHDALMFHTFCKYCIIWELSVFSSTLMLKVSCGYSCFHLMYLLQGHVLDKEWGRMGVTSNHIKINISPLGMNVLVGASLPSQNFRIILSCLFQFYYLQLENAGSHIYSSLKLISLNLCLAKTQVSFSFNADMAFSGLRLHLQSRE